MNKRGSFLYTGTVIAAMMAFLLFLILSYQDTTERRYSNGEDQFLFLRGVYEGEKLLFYTDKAAEQSLIETLVIFSRSGGIKNTQGEYGADIGCGTYRGATLLNTETKECFVTSAEAPASFKAIFAEHMNFHLSSYPGAFFFTSPEDLIVTAENGITVRNANHLEPVTIRIGKEREQEDDIDFGGTKWTFWPVEGPVTDCFGGPRNVPGAYWWHEGIDFSASEGTPIRSPDSGTVDSICVCPLGETRCCSGFGNTMVIKHSDELYTRYAHLSKFEKQKGDRVAVGEVIGRVGNTGFSTGAHLHFSTYTSKSFYTENDYSQNPTRFLPKEYNGYTNHCKEDSYS